MLSEHRVPLAGIQNLELHLERRKNWARGLNPAALKAYEPMIDNRTRELLTRLEEQIGQINISDWFNLFA